MTRINKVVFTALATGLFGLFFLPCPLIAAPATHLSVAFLPAVCPTLCPPIARTTPGQSVPVTVVALDSLGNQDLNYTGTVSFSSSDPTATLPATYTFTAADQGVHNFPADTVFQTLGHKTLTVTDAANAFTSSTSIYVVDVPGVSIPTTTAAGALILVGLLAAGGAWVLSRSA